MNFPFRHGAILLCFFAACFCARAQSLTITDPSYVSTKLFDSTVGYTITGMAADGLGNVYYIETDTNGTGNTRLYKRSALNYASVTQLYNFGAPVGGAFVVFSGGKLYFGENTNGNIYTINADGTGTADLLGVIPSSYASYDASFFNGNLLVLYDRGFSDSRLSSFSLVADGSGGQALGSENVILNASGDYMGVFEYVGGNLYYGASGFNPLKGLYEFSAAEVTAAFGSGELLLDDDHKFGATTTTHVSGLAIGDGFDLWKTGNPSTDLLRISRYNEGVDPVGYSTGNSSLGQLEFAGNSLFLNVTDFNTPRSAIYKLAVPEPSSAAVLLAGSLVFLRRRR